MEPPKPGPKRQSTLAFSPKGNLALADDAPPPAKSPAATREAASRLKTKPHQGLYVDKNKPNEHNDELREGEDLDDADEEPRLEPERVVVLDETEDENYVDSPETDGKEENGEAQSSGSAEFDESEEDEVEELETVASRAAGRRTAASGSTAKTGREEGRIAPVASGSGTRREKKDDAATPGPGALLHSPSLPRCSFSLLAYSTGHLQLQNLVLSPTQVKSSTARNPPPHPRAADPPQLSPSSSPCAGSPRHPPRRRSELSSFPAPRPKLKSTRSRSKLPRSNLWGEGRSSWTVRTTSRLELPRRARRI